MKSNDMKVLCDDNGNKYRFSAEKFKLALSNKKEKDKNNGIKTYSATLKRAIADRSGLSEEAVKKWEMGHNGPSNIDQVRIAADVLDIPYTALIDQVKKTGEINTVGERNKQLIDTIFRESLAILIQKAKYKPDGEDGKERNAQYRRNQKNTAERLRNLTGVVDGYALSTSPNVRNMLKRLIIEMQALVDDRPLDYWDSITEDIGNFDIGVLFSYFGCDREDILKDGEITARAYVIDETDFAEELGLEDIRYPDDAFDETDDPYKLGEYGYQGEFDITPDMVYEYCLTNYLKEVFKYYFPAELEGTI